MHIDPKVEQILRAAWPKRQISTVMLADQLGVSRNKIRNWGEQLGLGSKASRGASWPDDQLEALKVFVAEGKLSGREIGKRLGLSRSAVLGMAHRMGLKVREVGRKEASERQRAQRERVKTKGLRHKTPHAWQITPPAERPKPMVLPTRAWEPIPGTTPVSIMDLRSSHCRWPLEIPGAAEPMFCGCFAVGAYCQAHTKRAYQPQAAKKRVDDRLGVNKMRSAA